MGRCLDMALRYANYNFNLDGYRSELQQTEASGKFLRMGIFFRRIDGKNSPGRQTTHKQNRQLVRASPDIFGAFRSDEAVSNKNRNRQT